MKPRAVGEFGCTAEPSDAIMQAAAEMVEQEENEEFRITAGLNIDTYVHIVATSASPHDGYISVSPATLMRRNAAAAKNRCPYGGILIIFHVG